MGKFSIANKKHNIRNIIWNDQSVKNGMFVVRVEKNSQGWICVVDTAVTDTLLF